MTWPFENNTNGIVKNLAKRNLKSEKRRNITVSYTHLDVYKRQAKNNWNHWETD